METSIAGLTVSVTEPVTDPELAEIVAVPVDRPVAKPDPAIVATAVADELQLTELVRSRELPSLNTPLAVNCCVVPAAMDVEPGRRLMDTSVAGVTLKVVDPETAPDIAVILVLPPPTLEAMPELLIVATAVTVEVHITLVRTCELPSLNVPVAVNCCPAPCTTVGANGVTAMDTRVADVTFRFADPVIEPEIATTEVDPALWPVAMPDALTLATPAGDVLQVTLFDRSCVLPSLKVPTTESCSLAPTAMEELPGLTASETSTAGVTVSVVDPVIEPEVAIMFVLPVVALDAAPLALTLATAVLEDLQAIELVRSRLLPSLYFPVAVNCCPPPKATEGFVGETWTAVNVT